MQVSKIKKLVKNHNLDQIREAEQAITEGKELPIQVPGEDEGEQLTHAFAAKWIKEQMKEGEDLKDALRAYTKKVRKSIS